MMCVEVYLSSSHIQRIVGHKIKYSLSYSQHVATGCLRRVIGSTTRASKSLGPSAFSGTCTLLKQQSSTITAPQTSTLGSHSFIATLGRSLIRSLAFSRRPWCLLYPTFSHCHYFRQAQSNNFIYGIDQKQGNTGVCGTRVQLVFFFSRETCHHRSLEPSRYIISTLPPYALSSKDQHIGLVKSIRNEGNSTPYREGTVILMACPYHLTVGWEQALWCNHLIHR